MAQPVECQTLDLTLGLDLRVMSSSPVLDSMLAMEFVCLFVCLFERGREREAETQAEGGAGSMHREPDVGFDPGSPGSRPGPKTGAKPLRHTGIPWPYIK